MKFRKTAAAVLAAVMAVGTVSAVSHAATTDNEIRENSKYEIILEKTIVDGEEKAAVIFKGLPKEVFTFEYAHRDEHLQGEYEGTKVIWVSEFDNRFSVYVEFGEEDGDLRMTAFPQETGNEHKWVAWNGKYGDNREEYPIISKEEGDTITLTVDLDLNNPKLKDLASKDKTVVTTYVEIHGWGSNYYDTNNDGHISDNEENENGWAGFTGDANEDVPIYSNEKIKLHTSDKWNATAKESVKITNNLNVPETSEPASEPVESTVTPGSTDTVSAPESGTNEQTVLEVTLKNLDSENGIEGAALDKQLFGDSGWTWNEVEKIEFTSDKPFSVQFAVDNDGWKTLGEEAARDAIDGKWNTEWTLNASEMAKNKKYAKVIAKEGTTDVKATVYIKQGAVKPSADGQKPTGITLAIAPVVLTAGAAIVLLKKRK